MTLPISSRKAVWLATAVTGVLLLAVFAVTTPGSLAFLTFQRDRGTEVESLGALPLHFARRFGWWDGEKMVEHQLDAFTRTARTAMSRRNEQVGPSDEKVWAKLFEATKGERK